MKNILSVTGRCTSHGGNVGFQFKSAFNPATGCDDHYLCGSFTVNDFDGDGEESVANGGFMYGQGYAGCADCGAKYVYQCGHCSAFNCYDGKAHTGLVCPVCGKTSAVAATHDDRIVRSNPAPKIKIVLAMDVSSSMNERTATGKTRLREMQDAAVTDFVRRFESAEIAVVAFETRVRTVLDFTKNGSAVERAINSLQAGGGTTSPLAHIRSAFSDFAGGAGDGRYVVVFTDGEWAGNSAGHISSAQTMRKNGLNILTIGCAGADKNFLRSVASQGASIDVVGDDFGSAFATAAKKISQ